jgi:pyruvate/2-oxoglutarate dehydrogenase complex dihydrolipoamide dehydrogenase (E3) component
MDQAKAGRRVAVIEAGMICGSCINIACIPPEHRLLAEAEKAYTEALTILTTSELVAALPPAAS